MINASALLNGKTIDWMPMEELGECHKVYHAGTEAHDVILTNGVPAAAPVTFLNHWTMPQADVAP